MIPEGMFEQEINGSINPSKLQTRVYMLVSIICESRENSDQLHLDVQAEHFLYPNKVQFHMTPFY